MKIRALFNITLLLVVFSSCSKDEIENLSTSELIGFWRISNVNFEGTATINEPGGELTAPIEGSGYNLALSIEFGEIENEFTSKGSYNIHLTTKINDEDV